MFHAPGTAGLPAQPPQGVGARVVRRFSQWRAALHSVIAGRLHLRQPGPRARIARDAASPPAPSPAGRPHWPRATPSTPPPGPGRPDWLGWLTRLSARSQAAVGARPRRNGPLTLEEFPGIAPEALAFFNTPMEESDPELLHCVYQTFAELIEPAMSGRSRAPDVQDVFRALSSRLAAARAEAADQRPAAPPEPPPASADASRDAPGIPLDPRPEASPEPAEAAVIAAMNLQETTPDLLAPVLPQEGTGPHDPAGPQNPALPWADGVPEAACAADPESTTQDQPGAVPTVPPWCDRFAGNTNAPGAHTPDRSGITARRSRRALFRGRPSFGLRNFVLLHGNRYVLLPEYHSLRAPPAAPALLSCLRRASGDCWRAEPGAPSWRDMHGATTWRPRYPDSCRVNPMALPAAATAAWSHCGQSHRGQSHCGQSHWAGRYRALAPCRGDAQPAGAAVTVQPAAHRAATSATRRRGDLGDAGRGRRRGVGDAGGRSGRRRS